MGLTQSEQVFSFFSQPNDPHCSCCQKSHEQPEADFCQFWASGKQKVVLTCCLLTLCFNFVYLHSKSKKHFIYGHIFPISIIKNSIIIAISIMIILTKNWIKCYLTFIIIVVIDPKTYFHPSHIWWIFDKLNSYLQTPEHHVQTTSTPEKSFRWFNDVKLNLMMVNYHHFPNCVILSGIIESGSGVSVGDVSVNLIIRVIRMIVTIPAIFFTPNEFVPGINFLASPN